MYNGPSVSLCFYSQIGSAKLKKTRVSQNPTLQPSLHEGHMYPGRFRHANPLAEGTGVETAHWLAWRINRSMSET